MMSEDVMYIQKGNTFAAALQINGGRFKSVYLNTLLKVLRAQQVYII